MRVLYSADEIAARVEALAAEIVDSYDQDVVIIPILTGAFMFAADLARALARQGRDWEVDFLHLSSYGDERSSSGDVRLIKDVVGETAGRHILLVDDVLESGRSLQFARRLFQTRGAAGIKICVLADKAPASDADGRAEHVEADFVGFKTPPHAFLVGYGMDDAGRARGLPDLCVIDA